LTQNGALFTWGGNGYGKLGDGTNSHNGTSKTVKGMQGKRVIQASCGEIYTAIITDDGKLFTFAPLSLIIPILFVSTLSAVRPLPILQALHSGCYSYLC
jgi:hypothetical protein